MSEETETYVGNITDEKRKDDEPEHTSVKMLVVIAEKLDSIVSTPPLVQTRDQSG